VLTSKNSVVVVVVVIVVAVVVVVVVVVVLVVVAVVVVVVVVVSMVVVDTNDYKLFISIITTIINSVHLSYPRLYSTLLLLKRNFLL